MKGTITMNRILKLIALPLLAVVAAVAVVSTATAHVELESSVPAAGSTLSTPPVSVVLTFGGEIQKAAGKFELDVTSEAGDSVTAGAPTVSADGTGLSVALQSNLPPGTYTVTWMNTSAEDGDAEEGTFTFAVGSAPVEQPTAAPEAEHSHDDADMREDDADHAASASAPTTGLIVVYLAPQSGSGVDGRAEIMPADGGAKTYIGVYVGGIEPGSAHMNHVHEEASCSVETPGPHAAELTDITSGEAPYGKSITVIDVPFSVVANGEHTIRVHAGATGGDKTTVACGEIPKQPEGHGPVTSLPSTGDGPTEAGMLRSWLAGFIVAGAALAAVGVALRTKARP